MPDGQQYDYRTDPEFLKANPQDQAAYLKQVDPDFAKATPRDQAAYLMHIRGQDQPTDFEREHPPVPGYYGFTPSNLYQQTKQGLKGMVTGAYQFGKDALLPAGKTEGQKLNWLANKYIFDPAYRENAIAAQYGAAGKPLQSIGHSIAAALPLVGPWAAGLGEQAGQGDVGGALAQGTAQAATAEAIKPVARGIARVAEPLIGKSSDYIGAKLRTEKGSLTPGTRSLAQAGGAALGHMTGIPGGELMGFVLGRNVADALIPKRPIAPDPLQGRPTPFEGMTSSATPLGSAKLPIAGTAAPAPNVIFVPRFRRALAPSGGEAMENVARPAGSLILTPGEAASEAQLARIAKVRASERGMQFAAGMVPREGRSVPRLPTRIPSEEFSGVRERVALPAPETPLGRSVSPKLGIRSQARADLLQKSRAQGVPEWMAQEASLDMERLRKLSREGTPEEQAYANRILRDLEKK